jgi:hypothetical protein
VSTGTFRSSRRWKEMATFPSLTQIFIGDPMALWAIKCTVNLRALCDQDSLHAELVFLRDIFMQNGYTDQQIRRALNPPKGCPTWRKASPA